MTRRRVALGLALAALVAVAIVGAIVSSDSGSAEVRDANAADTTRVAESPAPLVVPAALADGAVRVLEPTPVARNAPAAAVENARPLPPMQLYGTITLLKPPAAIDASPNGTMDLIERAGGRTERRRVQIVGGRFSASAQRFGVLDFDSIELNGEDAIVPENERHKLAPPDGALVLEARFVPRVTLHVRDATTGRELENVIIDGETRGQSPLRAPRTAEDLRVSVGFFTVGAPGFESEVVGVDLTRSGTRFVALSTRVAQPDGLDSHGYDIARALLDRVAAAAADAAPAGPAVSGTVTIPPGRPIRGFLVRAEVNGVHGVSGFLLVGGPGTYRWSLRAPSAGRCRVAVDDNDGREVAATTLDIPVGGVTNVPLVVPPLATARIRLVDARDASLVTDPGILLMLAAVDRDKSGRGVIPMARDEADRSWFTCSLSSGEYRIVALRGDIAPLDDRITLAPGANEFAVRVARGTSLSVTVVAPDARIPASEFAHVSASSVEGGAASFDMIAADSDFAAHANLPRAGRWRVTLPRVNGYADVAPRDVDVVAGRATSVEFTLTPSP